MTTDPAAQLATLDHLDNERREIAVTGFLAGARDLLTQALAATNAPAAVVQIKAELASVEHATRQFNLSKEVRDDAAEMVRRAEWALGTAVRDGQAAGVIRKHGQRVPLDKENSVGPQEYISEGHQAVTEIFAIAKATDDQLDAALVKARDEGNLSRANVIRKVRGVKTDELTPPEKRRKIRDLAPTGMTSAQIAAEIGVGEQWVRKIAREDGITVTADKVMKGYNRVRVDSNHIVSHAVMTLEALITGFDRINTADLDDAQTQIWTDSLTHSIRALNRLIKQINKQIKETIQ